MLGTMSTRLADCWFSGVHMLLNEVRERNAEALGRAAALIGPSLAGGGVLHVFGSGHSEIIAREIVGRAGGLVCVSQILDPTGGAAENVPGYGTQLAEKHARLHGMLRGETVVVISNSGRNCSPIEVAQAAQAHGLHVVAVTALAMSACAELSSRHPSGRKLHQLAGVILDNGGVPGDALVPVAPEDDRSGPTSTVTGAALLNLLHLEVVQWLADHGHRPPLLRSQNLDGALEHNRALAARYRTRLSRPL